jgi:hypothetical protein
MCPHWQEAALARKEKGKSRTGKKRKGLFFFLFFFNTRMVFLRSSYRKRQKAR